MFFLKKAWVEWHPRGVLGAIVPWNYPFHNVLNPIAAALLSGNAIVIKVRACHRSGAPWAMVTGADTLPACNRGSGPNLGSSLASYAWRANPNPDPNQVSEHAAWSSRFYSKLIDACLVAAGAPADLVQLATLTLTLTLPLPLPLTRRAGRPRAARHRLRGHRRGSDGDVRQDDLCRLDQGGQARDEARGREPH